MIGWRLLLAVLICVSLTACGEQAVSTMDRIRQRGVLTVGIKFDHPLFGFKDPASGRITGFDAEIARLVARDLTGSERDIRFVETIPRNREGFLERGVVDIVVATYSITPARRARVGFTDPYYTAGQDALVRAGDDRIRDVTGLQDRRVCTASGSTSAARLKSRAPRADLVIVDTYSECVTALLAGQLDAISTDDTILRGMIAQHPNRLRLVGSPFGEEPYAIGLRRDDPAFRDYLNGLIARYLRDGQWDRAFRDTIGLAGADATAARPDQTATTP